MSFYTLHQDRNGRFSVKRTRTHGLRFILHSSTDEVVRLVSSYKIFKHFIVPSFKQHIINFSRRQDKKKWILQCFFEKLSFKDHAFNRNKSRAFAVGSFLAPSNDQSEEGGNVKVYVLLRSKKDRYWLIQVLAILDPDCEERRYTYPRCYFAVAVINQLMIFICRSTWCECSTHIDKYYISHHHNQEVTYFIHSLKLKEGSNIDVVLPRYMTYDKRYIEKRNEDEPLSLYYLCLSKLLTFYCGCIQTQLSYHRYERDMKRKYQE